MAFTASDLKDAYQLARQNCNSLTAEMLAQKGWPLEKSEQVMTALVKRRLCALRSKDGKLSLLARDEECAMSVRQLEENEYKVFCVIEAAGSHGAWTRDISSEARLPAHQVQKLVNSLSEMRKLIKPLKNIHQKNRKMYILSSLEPSTEVVGGSFYRDGEFDHDLVTRLREQIMHVLLNRSQATYADIQEFVKGSGVAGSLGPDDLTQVIRTLELEQSITKWVNAREESVYMVSRWPDNELFASMPCGSCPVARQCLRGTGLEPICPEQCAYIDYWLGYETDQYVHEPPPEEG